MLHSDPVVVNASLFQCNLPNCVEVTEPRSDTKLSPFSRRKGKRKIRSASSSSHAEETSTSYYLDVRPQPWSDSAAEFATSKRRHSMPTDEKVSSRKNHCRSKTKERSSECEGKSSRQNRWQKVFCPNGSQASSQRRSRSETRRSESSSSSESSISTSGQAQKPADSAKPFSHYIESTFVKECLVWHNLFRSRHNAPALALSPQLCASAQEWANFLARSDTFQYQNAKQIGENLLCRAMIHQSFGDVNGREVAVVWYSDVRKYDFNKRPDLLHVQAGSFTQMIWKTTKCFGIARARTKKSNKLFIVAHYYPKGNIPGRFHKEVLPVRRLEEESGSGQPERKRDRSPALGAIGYITSTFSLFAKTRDASSDGSRST